MTEEVITPEIDEPANEPIEDEAPKTAQELNDEIVANYLGVDPDYLVENKGKFKDLQGLYKKLNSERIKQSQQQKVAPQPVLADDEDVALDEASRKILDKYFEQKMAPLVQVQQTTLAEQFAETIDGFVEANPDDDHDAIASIMEDLFPQAKTPAELKRNMQKARRVWLAESRDPESEAERIAAEKLEQVKAKGDVVEVKSKAKGSIKPRSQGEILDDPNIPWFEKFKQFAGE